MSCMCPSPPPAVSAVAAGMLVGGVGLQLVWLHSLCLAERPCCGCCGLASSQGYCPCSCKTQPRCMVVHSSQQVASPGISNIQVGFTKVCCPGLSPWAETQLPPASLAGASRSVSSSPSQQVFLSVQFYSFPGRIPCWYSKPVVLGACPSRAGFNG